MLSKDQLRKTDLLSSVLIVLFGLWVVGQAFQLPMKDSWGGVMNVWYVSPALMPLFIGSMITLLGAILFRIALKNLGASEAGKAVRWLFSSDLVRVLTSDATVRFYAIALLFLTLVYLNLPRIDFFVSAVLFLFAFISMFYFFDDRLLRRLLGIYLAGEALLLAYFVLGLDAAASRVLAHPADVLALAFTLAYATSVWVSIRHTPAHRRLFRISVLVALAAPLVIEPVFKYFLKVPMPKEGLVSAIFDAIWYRDF